MHSSDNFTAGSFVTCRKKYFGPSNSKLEIEVKRNDHALCYCKDTRTADLASWIVISTIVLLVAITLYRVLKYVLQSVKTRSESTIHDLNPRSKSTKTVITVLH